MKVEIVKCSTPQHMKLDLCKNCKRATAEKSDEFEMFHPKKTMFDGWKCDGYINKNQGS